MRLLALLLMLMTSGAPHLLAEVFEHDDVTASAERDDCGCADDDCSPVCHDCVCVGRALAIGPPLFAPVPVQERALVMPDRSSPIEGPTRVPPSPPGLGVFHPPRA